MKINILYKIKKGPWGGGNQFIKALKDYFKKKKVYADLKNADVILFNSHHFFKKVIRAKRKYANKIFIHRIDGPLSLVRGGDKKIDKAIFNFNHFVADGTVFQSKWSKNKNYSLGMKKNNFTAIIINASDPQIFYPFRKKKALGLKRKIRLIASSWSANPRKGFDIYRFLDKNLDFSKYEMTFVGNSQIKFQRIKYILPQTSKKLAKLLRKHDIFITANINDPCSNSLIEALHCGLPAVARNSGGHPEIIGKAGAIFRDKKDVLLKIEKISKNLNYYRKAIDLFDIFNVGDLYYNFCKKIYNKVQKGEYVPKKLNFFDYWRLI